jgi:hypothetical protein
VLLISRWSMVLAMAAAEHPATLNVAWTSSRAYGWAMVRIQAILVLALAIFSILPMAAVSPDLTQRAEAGGQPSRAAQLTLQLTGTIVGAAFLWLTSTMYALVYRRVLQDRSTAPPPPAEGP